MTAAGDKENAMTVSLSKRLFEGDATTASLTSPTPASKKMRMLSPLAEHVGAACQTKPGAAGVGALQQQHHSSARKRRHDTSTEHSSGVASPLNSGKRVSDGSVIDFNRSSWPTMMCSSFSWLYCLWSKAWTVCFQRPKHTSSRSNAISN